MKNINACSLENNTSRIQYKTSGDFSIENYLLTLKILSELKNFSERKAI